MSRNIVNSALSIGALALFAGLGATSAVGQQAPPLGPLPPRSSQT